MKRFAPLFLLPLVVLACSSSTTESSPTSADAGSSSGDPPEADAGTDAPTTSGGCSSAREQLLRPIDKVASGEVKVVSDAGGVKTIYVDAAAGGPAGASKNPRVYLDLGAGAKVDVTDPGALESTAWDLSLKRTVLYTNGGDGGPGQGAAAVVNKGFDAVTAADADAAKLEAESFFDDECNPKTDAIGGPATIFSEWYEYDQATNVPTPRNITYVVKGGTGKRYKVGIASFTANPDGSTDRASTGYFLLKVSEL